MPDNDRSTPDDGDDLTTKIGRAFGVDFGEILAPDETGECHARFPNSIVKCQLPWGHTGDHANPRDGQWAMTWKNDVPKELPHDAH